VKNDKTHYPSLIKKAYQQTNGLVSRIFTVAMVNNRREHKNHITKLYRGQNCQNDYPLYQNLIIDDKYPTVGQRFELCAL